MRACQNQRELVQHPMKVEVTGESTAIPKGDMQQLHYDFVHLA